MTRPRIHQEELIDEDLLENMIASIRACDEFPHEQREAGVALMLEVNEICAEPDFDQALLRAEEDFEWCGAMLRAPAIWYLSPRRCREIRFCIDEIRKHMPDRTEQSG